MLLDELKQVKEMYEQMRDRNAAQEEALRSSEEKHKHALNEKENEVSRRSNNFGYSSLWETVITMLLSK